MMTTTNEFKCMKCDGTGKVCFRHIEGGRCFQCGGTGRMSARRPTRRSAPTAKRFHIGYELSWEDENQAGDSHDDIATAHKVARNLMANLRGERGVTVWILDRKTGETVWAYEW